MPNSNVKLTGWISEAVRHARVRCRTQTGLGSAKLDVKTR